MTAVRERASIPGTIFTHLSLTMGSSARYKELRSISSSSATCIRGSPLLRSMHRKTASCVTFMGEAARAASYTRPRTRESFLIDVHAQGVGTLEFLYDVYTSFMLAWPSCSGNWMFR